MYVQGFQKTTLLDFPEHLAATVFLKNCNFICPFCHNAGLVLNTEQCENISFDDVLAHLKKRSGVTEGVCFTGGEPTLNKDLAVMIREVKSLGMLIKLDTNGYNPQVLEELLSENLLDYVAMDIKAGPTHYPMATGKTKIDMDKIKASISLLENSTIDHEFRTTLVKGIHDDSDLIEIGALINNTEKYFLQNYRESDFVINKIFKSFDDSELQHFKDIVKPFIPNVKIRGEY